MLKVLKKEVSSESTERGQLENGNVNLDSDKLDGALGLTLAQLLKRPEVQIERLAPLLHTLMPGFFERVDSGQGIVDRIHLTNTRTPQTEVPQGLKSVCENSIFTQPLVRPQIGKHNTLR